ncbi:MAG: hypothetical protein OER80_04065 [Gammaproteobacteria bacterium]|nr:hypothetical protein [Gammaproteobacteria bacterium]MDH3768401.1 hypothetical protein [Gammaproteobacteria bacterium]
MTDRPIHRMYLHFQELPLSRRFLYTGTLLVLAAGYAFALLYIYTSHSGHDGNAITLSFQDIVIAYSGSDEGTRLESALHGPMSGMLPRQDIVKIVKWINDGATKADYESNVSTVIDRYCLSCHDGSNPHLSNLDGYENLKTVVDRDTGMDIFTLVRVSHIHLFGLTFIFFIMGLIFSHAFLRPVWFKCAVVIAPFIGIAVDVSSWYITKLFNPFAVFVMISGALMAACFAYMWVVSLYQIWFYKMPDYLTERDARPNRTIG